MLKKFKDKLHLGSPSKGSPSPNIADNSSGRDTLINATQTTLTLAKESVAGLPVPGLEAAIGGLLHVLTIYKDVKANEGALKAFNEAVERLNKNLVLPLGAAHAKDPDFIDDDLQKCLEGLANDLTALTTRTDALKDRKNYKKIANHQDDQGAIQDLNRELDRTVMEFTARVSISVKVDARAAKRLAEVLVIDKLPRAQARHDSASRAEAGPCFMGTRTSILQTISAWIDNPNEPPIYWLSGMAGIGKSTIAHTIAEQEDKKHRLGASFFFSRAEADRRNHLLVYPTIAYQLAGFNDSLRESIVQVLETDADIGGRQMQKQFDHLIAGPLSKLKFPGKTILFVLDALDECALATGAVEILTRCAVELPRISKEIGVSLKLFLTSRPELHIQDQFNERSLQGAFNSFVLHDAERSVVRADIELFLTQRLGDLAMHYRVSQPWPTAEEVKALALRSDNLFVFASTTINFIGGVKSGRALQHRLDRLLKPDSNNSTSAYAQLDALYCQVLVDAENELEETLPNPKDTFRKVLETIVLLLNPLPVTSLAELLSLEMDDVLTATQDLRSILIIPDDPTSSETIHIFHPSFYDFITTTGRDSKGFMIATIHGHGRLAKLCLSAMNDLLKKDPCSIDNPWLLNSEVQDLKSRLDKVAPTHLQYSCRFALAHVSQSLPGDENLEKLLDAFFGSKLLMWLEMMSLLGYVDGAIASVQQLKSWCHNNPNIKGVTADLVYDTYRVLLQYQSPLRLSAGHVYTTILSFAPVCSLTKQYASQLHVRYVLRGQPTHWDAGLVTAGGRKGVCVMAYFPDGQRIATGDESGRVTVWSTSTGAEIVSMQEQEYGSMRKIESLAVSGDGSRIASLHQRIYQPKQINIWDATAGVSIWRLEGPDAVFSIHFIGTSSAGAELLSLTSKGAVHRWNLITGEIVSNFETGSSDVVCASVSPDGLLFSIVDFKSWSIWGVDGNHIRSVEEKMNWKEAFGILPSLTFLPDRQRILLFSPSGVPHDVVMLRDHKNNPKLKEFSIPNATRVAVSNDGTRMATVLLKSNRLQIWDIEGGSLLGEIAGPVSTIQSIAFSPIEMILASVASDGTLQTWDIGDIHSGESTTVLETDQQPFTYLSASRNGNCVLSICAEAEAAQIWDTSDYSCSSITIPGLRPCAELSPDGLFFVCATGGSMGSAWLLYETETLQRRHTWTYTPNAKELGNAAKVIPSHAVFSEDSQRVAITFGAMGLSAPTVTEVWDLPQGKKLCSTVHPKGGDGFTFSPDGMSLLARTQDGHTALDVLKGTKETFRWRYWKRQTLRGYEPVFRLHPDGVHFLVIENTSYSGVNSYLVNIKDPSQRTPERRCSFAYQLGEPQLGYEPDFFMHNQMGNLFRKTGNSEEVLCWLPPMWRFPHDMKIALCRGSYLIVSLWNGRLGVIDLDVLSRSGSN